MTLCKHGNPPSMCYSCDVATETKGVKYDSGKPRWSLFPPGSLASILDILEFGARKYAPDNWKQVPGRRQRYYDAAMRHIDAWWQGEIADPETGKNHLWHAICCLIYLAWMDDNGAHEDGTTTGRGKS